MSAAPKRGCLDEFKPSSFPTQDEAMPPPSATMSTAEYTRIHANISPSKLRDIIKNEIFPSDDVEYLKRIVGDIGNMEYVFRFLWCDGPKPVSYFCEWDDTPVEHPQSRGGATEWNESPTRGETNWGSSIYHGSRRRAATDASRSSHDVQPSVRSSVKFEDPNRSGRTWIQYCCYYNAHRCLEWIFRKIVRNHLLKLNQEQEKQASASEHGLRGSLTRQTNTRKLSKEVHSVHIINQLLTYPSHCYCATNYVAVATIRNSHDCLLLLLQHGGLDPNMKINSFGSTAAHLASWKNNVECLRVLKSGCYVNGFEEDNGEDSFDEDFNSDGNINNTDGGDDDMSSDSFSSIDRIKTWASGWNRTNEQGETPVHVAAKEGSCKAMQFFVDLVVSYAEVEAMRDYYGKTASRPHCLSEDRNRETKQYFDNSDRGSHPPVDFSLRNKEGMDCAALASHNNHFKIIEILASGIHQMKKIEEEKSRDIKQSASDSIWEHPSILESIPQDRSVKPPSHSHLTSLRRRRANTDPVRFHSEHKLPNASLSEHGINSQLSLPGYYPSLDLRNPHEKINHEAPIHVAARQNNVAAMKALFDSGCCDVVARDSLGQTALHVAVLAHRLEIIQFFVRLNFEQFKKFDVVDILGRTPFYIACSEGYSELAKILLTVSNWRVLCHEKRQSLDSPLLTNVAQGRPPLHAAVVNNHVDTVRVLLENGVDVDQLDKDGRTAIISAAKLGLKDMCQMLIRHGADVNARSSKGGPTPYQKAKKYKHVSVSELIYEFGGR